MRIQLAGFWLFYMGGLGIFFPYFSLYLGEELGLSESQIGLVVATLPALGLVAQPLWGHLADSSGSRRRVLALIAAGIAVANGVLGTVRGFAGALAATAGLAVFHSAALPLATAVSLAARGAAAFGVVRMWGTVGFLAVVVAFPRLLPHLPELAGGELRWMFPATALLSAIAAGLALTLPTTDELTVRSRPGDARRLLRHRPIVRLLGLSFAAHLAMQGPIYLFPLYLRQRGGSAADVGEMWIYMLLLEIPLIGLSGRTLRRLGARGLLQLGLGAEALRWTICALSTDLDVIRWAMLLHGVGVAGVLVGAPLYLEQAVPGRLRATGQALVAAAGTGAGSIVSIAATGWLLQHHGAGVTYGLAGALAAALGLGIFLWLPKPTRPA